MILDKSLSLLLVGSYAFCHSPHPLTRLSNFTFTFHFHALEKEMATHSSILAWRIPGMAEPGGLPSMGSQRVRHDWSDLAAAAHPLHPNICTSAQAGTQSPLTFTWLILTHMGCLPSGKPSWTAALLTSNPLLQIPLLHAPLEPSAHSRFSIYSVCRFASLFPWNKEHTYLLSNSSI